MELPPQNDHGTNVDVLVIGRGLAGTMAALRARELGASVAIVHADAGASVHSSGAFNLADTLSLKPAISSCSPLDPGESWDKLVAAVALKNPNHFYGQIPSGQLSKFLKATKCFGKHLHDLVEVPERAAPNKVLASGLGTFKHAAFCQRSADFDFNQLPKDCYIGVVEFTGLLGYEASAVIRMLEWMVSLTAHRPLRFTPVSVDIQVEDLYWKSPLQAAAMLDDPRNQSRFFEAFSNALTTFQPEPKFFLLPPVLGIESTAQIINTLEANHRIHAREILSGSQSVMGQRLARALEIALRKVEASVLKGKVLGWDAKNKHIHGITVEEDGHLHHFHPKQVVLASGRHLGGGLQLKSRWAEPVFNLTPYIDEKPVAEIHPTEVTRKKIEASQAIFEGGLKYDSQMRPKDAFMNVPFDNLRLAGSIMQSSDAMIDGTSSGVSILSGYLAGEFAAGS